MKKNALFMSPYEDNTHLENEIDTLEDIEYIFTDLGIEVDDE